MTRKHLIRAHALVLGTALAALADAAEQVVLESSNAQYPAGRTIDSAAEIVLARDELIVFATEDGRLIRIAGPYTGPAEGVEDAGEPAGESTVRRVLAQLFGLRPQEAEALAGVRGSGGGAEDADNRADPWLLHAQRTGDQCIVGGRPVRLWREPANAAAVELVAVSDGRAAPLQWQERGDVADWPAGLELVDGAVYLVREAGDLRSAAIRVHALPAALDTSGLAAVAWLASRGCLDQARLLLREANAGGG